jgi:hypothetical protein
MLGYVRWRRCGRTRWLILCGLAGGAAPWFKQSGAAALAACAVHMAWRGWRDRTRGRGPRALEVGAVPGRLAAVGLVGGASAAAPSLAVLAGLWATGSVGEALFAVGRFNKAYFVTGDATWFAPKAMGVFLPDLAVIAGLLAFAAIGLIAIAAGAVRGHLSRRDPADHTVETAALFLMWFVAALWLAAMAPGRRSHHLMPALPPVGLLALLPFALLAKQRPLAAALIARPSAAVLAVLFVTALGNVGVESLREVNAIWRQKPTWYSTQRIVPRGPQLRARAIRRLAPRARSMYVWGWSPGTYRFALLPCPSRYATIEKVGQVGQPAQFIVEGAVADLRRTPADVFVISTGDYAALAEPADAFGAWLDSEYEDREVVDGMHILVRRSIDQERNEPREGREQNRPPTQTGGQDGRP